MSLSLPHAASVWRRNASMYRRTWMVNLLPNFFEPVLYLVAIGVGVGAYINEMGGTSYAAFLAPGLVCVAAMNGASLEEALKLLKEEQTAEDEDSVDLF